MNIRDRYVRVKFHMLNGKTIETLLTPRRWHEFCETTHAHGGFADITPEPTDEPAECDQLLVRVDHICWIEVN